MVKTQLMVSLQKGIAEQARNRVVSKLKLSLLSSTPLKRWNLIEGHMQYAPTKPQLSDRRGVLLMPTVTREMNKVKLYLVSLQL